ncbi:MAG: SPASM domain-containing protein [Verrucomicrobiota bacterium]
MSKRFDLAVFFRCGAGIGTFHVDPRGQMHPCMMWRATPFDLLNQPAEAWKASLEELRSRERPAESKCGTCVNALACGNCPATSRLEAGEAGRPVDYYCRISEAREKLLNMKSFRTSNQPASAV